MQRLPVVSEETTVGTAFRISRWFYRVKAQTAGETQRNLYHHQRYYFNINTGLVFHSLGNKWCSALPYIIKYIHFFLSSGSVGSELVSCVAGAQQHLKGMGIIAPETCIVSLVAAKPLLFSTKNLDVQLSLTSAETFGNRVQVRHGEFWHSLGVRKLMMFSHLTQNILEKYPWIVEWNLWAHVNYLRYEREHCNLIFPQLLETKVRCLWRLCMLDSNETLSSDADPRDGPYALLFYSLCSRLVQLMTIHTSFRPPSWRAIVCI